LTSGLWFWLLSEKLGWFLCIYSLTLYFACCGSIACLFKDTRAGLANKIDNQRKTCESAPARSNQKPNIGANSDLIILI